MSKTLRDSNFELLRAISCFMIIVLHFLSMGGALGQSIPGSINYYICHFLESVCIVSVNCFVLISGYFMIKKNETSLSKIVKLLSILLFYNGIMFLIAIFTKTRSFSITELVLVFFPFLGGRRWFIETYIILFLFIPFLNKLLSSLSKREYIIFLVLYMLFFSIWPTFLISPPIEDGGGYGITNFILLYALGGFIRLHCADKIKQSKYFYFILYILTTICIFVLSTKIGRVWNYNSIFNIFSSVFLFLFFMKLKLKSSFINVVSSLSFGIFILHSDPMLRDRFYELMDCKSYYNSPWFLVHLIICCVLSYIIFAAIDFIREKIFVKTIYKIVDKIKIFNYKIKVK